QFYFGPRTILVAKGKQSLATRQMIGPYDRADLECSLLERHFANRAAFAVGHIEPRAISRQTARLSERGGTTRERLTWRQVAVDDIFKSVPGIRPNFFFVERHFPNLVAARHRYVEFFVMDVQRPGAA